MTSLTNIASKIIDRGSKETIDGHTKHWWQHEINNARADGYKRGYASGKKVMRDAAVKVCREYDASVWSHCNASSHAADMVSATLSQAIAALPVPEVQWRDLTDDEIWDVFISKDWTGEPLQLVSAVIAAFKEKNK